MLTTDLTLKVDPEYVKIAKRFHGNQQEFTEAFSRAWYKLTHRDMGPITRYLGPLVPKEQLIWQDPIPPLDHPLVDGADISALKGVILASGLSIPQLVKTAWASAATFRCGDKRGGANGGRIRLSPQKDWAVNEPQELAAVLRSLEKIQNEFNQSQVGGKRVSIADLIVLGASAAIEVAATNSGHQITVPFLAGRMDATQEQTDVASFSVLEPTSDGFRNYFQGDDVDRAAAYLIDRANQLTLTAPELTVLIGGMRALNANMDQSSLGVLTKTPGTLTNEFFIHLLDMGTIWTKSKSKTSLEGHDRKSGDLKWTATVVDLVFGSNAELRALAEVYASSDAKVKFVRDFVAAWTKVMNLDRFDCR